MLFYRNTQAKVTLGDTVIEDMVFSINVGNGVYCGGGMRQTPDAIPTDGLLNITIIRNISKFDIIKNLNILYDGTILKHPKIDGFTAKNIEVTSDSLLYTEADGESLGHTPASFGIIPAALKIVYAKNFTQKE
jgi:diacylglycerol kinase family enzyme